MNIVRFNQRKPFVYNKFMDEFFNKNISDFLGTDDISSQPAVNIIEENDAFLIELAAPGMAKENFDIQVEKNHLVVKSEKKDAEVTQEGRNYRRREFSYHAFSRSFTIPETIDREKIDGTYVDGVLRITLPKKEDAKEKSPITITVQ